MAEGQAAAPTEQAAPESRDEKRRRIRGWAVVVLLAAIFGLGMVDRIILSMMVTPIKADLMLSDTTFGLAQGAAVAVFYVLFAFPFGWAADRFDRRVVLFLGVTAWSLASASCAFVRNFAELFAARSLIGAGEAVLGPVGYPMIAALVSRHRLALAMTVFYLGGTLGIAFGQYAGGALLDSLSREPMIDVWLLGEMAPWRVVFLLTGPPGIFLALLIFFAPANRPLTTPAPPKGRAAPGFGAFFQSHKRFYLAHNMGIGLQQAALTGAILWNAAFMTRTYGWSPAQIGLIFGILLLVTSSAAVIGHGWITTRLFVKGRTDVHMRWQLGMSCLSIPAIALAYLWPSPWAACIGFGIANLLSGGSVVAGPTILQIATPDAYRGRISAIYVVIATMLGTAVGPALIGLISDHILQDEAKIGIAMAGACVMFLALAIIAFGLSLAATRRIVEETAAAG